MNNDGNVIEFICLIVVILMIMLFIIVSLCNILNVNLF